MSDDLISRKALLKELREILNEPHNTMFLMGIGAAITIIKHSETAFDKEKVKQELEISSKLYSLNDRDCEFAIPQNIALEIIEKGGIK